MEVTDPKTGVTTKVPPELSATTATNGRTVNDAYRSSNGSSVRLNSRGLSQEVPTVGELPDFKSDHPILQITRARYGHGHLKELQLVVYHVMRRYVPTLDTAINNRRMLEGSLEVEAEDDPVQEQVEGFIESVPVGYVDQAPQRGLDTYLELLSDKADEYGFAAGEVIVDGGEISRVVAPNPRTLTIMDRDGDGLDEVYQSRTTRAHGEREDRRIDDKATVHTLTFSHPTENGWPRPLAWSLVTNTEAVLRMYEAVANGWYRFGDPSMLFTEEYDLDANPDTRAGEDSNVPASTESLANQILTVMQKRKRGKTSDAFHAVQGAEVNAEVIGDVDQSLLDYFQQHQSVYGGLVVSAAQVPKWMHPELESSGDGMNSTRAENQNSLAAEAAKKRDEKRAAVAREIIDMHLTLSGNARMVGEYDLSWDRQSLANEKMQNEAMKLQAEAEAQAIKNANVLGNRFGADTEQYLDRYDLNTENNA
jgi:hypothetical protein